MQNEVRMSNQTHAIERIIGKLGEAELRWGKDQKIVAGPSLDIARCMRIAREKHGKSFSSQVGEIFRLSRGPGQLTPRDYYYYGLYDDSRYDAAEKRRFLSDRVHPDVIRRCCDVGWWGVGDDKVLAYLMLRGLDAPIPEVFGLYHPFRVFPGAPTWRTTAELETALRETIGYPFFAKPSSGVQSVGVVAVTAFDSGTDRLLLRNGEAIEVGAFVRDMTDKDEGGFIFQDLLHPHPALAEVCGDRISTVRLMTVIEEGGPEIISTIWKLAVGSNDADNFWRPGNALAALDAGTGRVTRVVQGKGPDQREIAEHPDTGKPLIGFELPDWRQLIELCLRCTAALPKLRFQSWDIAPCVNGHVIVEVNTGAAFSLPQLATGKGFMTDRFRKFLHSFPPPVRGWRIFGRAA